ncbi:ATP-sensitive inward rectifier potassium channel 1-like [Trichomycterus rosablanca]|uniref:ATP-sensitive inward rectifier potassium channel 1-like n=1 Tax=Trichomycterus rosablanca TaxID=2290929 RepID=UPI002F35BC1C
MFQTLRNSLSCCRSKRQNHPSRLVNKNGHCNVEYRKMKLSNYFTYVLDIWSTSVEIRWYSFIFLYVASFIFSWFIFTLLWYWVAYSNGDLWWQNSPANHTACVLNVYDLTTAYLFSVETELTIGYGFRVITPVCTSAITVFIAQILVGIMICCFWCGVLMAKIALPMKVAKAVTFSKMAVISVKQDALCLQIRVANIRKSLLLGGQVYGKLIRSGISSEGRTTIMKQINIDFLVDGGNDNLFFVCPLTLYHVIDESSPFFRIPVDTLNQQDLELVVFLDGTAESTSSSCQVRTSYIPQEIMWGHKFLPIISRSKQGKYHVDFSNFEKVEPVQTTYCYPDNHLSVVGIDNKGFEVIEMSDY